MKKALVSVLLICSFCFSVLAGGSTATSGEALPVDSDFVLSAAVSAALVDLRTGNMLFESNSGKRLPLASVTKIMTMLLIIEAAERGEISFSDTVCASEHASKMGGSQIYLKAGEEMTVEELYKAVSIASANDAAVALAEYVGGSEGVFVSRMNERALELGMTDTCFRNACGLDEEGHYSSARDIAVMSCELAKHELAFKYTTTWMDSVRNGEFGLVNTNKLIRSYTGITGLKTGSTGKAGYCISATAERGGITLCAVIMGCETAALRFESAASLLDYGFASYELCFLDEGVALPQAEVKFGTESSVELMFAANEPVLVKRGTSSKVVRSIELAEQFNAPVAEGENLGRLVVTINGESVGEVSILAVKAVDKLTFGLAFRRMLALVRLF